MPLNASLRRNRPARKTFPMLRTLAVVLALAFATTAPAAGDPGKSAPRRTPAPAPAPVAGGPDNDADLYGRTVFQVLLAEIALQRGQIDMGVGAYADLARRTRDAKVAYTAGRRLYGNVEGRLLFSFDRATEDEELQPYLWAQLERA